MMDTKWKDGTKLMECVDCHTTLVVNPYDLITVCWGCMKWGFTEDMKVSVGGSHTRLKDGEV